MNPYEFQAKVGLNKAAINTGYGEMRKLSIDPKYLRYVATRRGGKCSLSRKRGGKFASGGLPVYAPGYDYGRIWGELGRTLKTNLFPLLNEQLGRLASHLASRVGASVLKLISDPDRFIAAMKTYVPRAWQAVKGFFSKLVGKKKRVSATDERVVAQHLDDINDDLDEEYGAPPPPALPPPPPPRTPRRRRPTIEYDDGYDDVLTKYDEYFMGDEEPRVSKHYDSVSGNGW